MTPGARIQAATEILDALRNTDVPADEAVKAWGRAHRFAGAKDRAAIRDLVFTAFRHRGEAALAMGTDEPRAIVLGTLRLGLGWAPADIEAAMTGRGYDAAALSRDETDRLAAARLGDHPASVNWPPWIAEFIVAQYGADAERLMAALLQPAPLDLRVNILKANLDDMLSALCAVGFDAAATPYSPWGIRIARAAGLGGANVRTLPIFHSGMIEIQDEGSQLAALASAARPGEFVIEPCAGGGGKTLALAAMMSGEGRILACDVDKGRLAAGASRVARAGLTSVQHLTVTDWAPEDGGRDPQLADYHGSADLVFLDVPCSGSGAWRRQPEAKWRLTPDSLDRQIAVQRRILRRAAPLVRPGGRLLYVTCSVFDAENGAQIDDILASAPGARFARAHDRPGALRQLLPTTTQTDGFFIATLEAVS